MQPGAVSRISTRNSTGEHLLDHTCVWTTLAASDLPAVDFANRHNFSGCAGKESLVALKQTVERQGPGFYLPAEITGELQHAIAGYAQENGVLRAIGNQ